MQILFCSYETRPTPAHEYEKNAIVFEVSFPWYNLGIQTRRQNETGEAQRNRHRRLLRLGDEL